MRIILPGNADVQSAIEAINRMSIFRLLMKPCSGMSLRTAVADALKQHQLVIAERQLSEDVAAAVSGSDCGTAGCVLLAIALGVFAATIRLPLLSPIWAGIIVGLLTSAPDAVITKTYAPILGTSVLFGAVCGWAVGRWGVRSITSRRRRN